MTRLLTTSWTLVAASSAVLTAAEGVIGTDTLRQLHDQPARRVEHLIRRGQTDGVFTTDLPLTWLVSAVHYLIHGASIEVRAGRLDPDQAGPTLTTSILAILSRRLAPEADSDPRLRQIDQSSPHLDQPSSHRLDSGHTDENAHLNGSGVTEFSHDCIVTA